MSRNFGSLFFRYFLMTPLTNSGLPKDRAAKVADLVWRIETVKDIGEVTALLRV